MGFTFTEDISKKYETIPLELDPSNSLFVIVGNSDITADRSISLPGVLVDIANFKRTLLSDTIGFQEENILTLINLPESTIFKNIEKAVNKKNWATIFFYFSGTGVRTENGETSLVCKSDNHGEQYETITADELKYLFKDTKARLVLLLDCCHAQGFFKKFYNKNVFILGAVLEDEAAMEDYKSGGIFTSGLLDILKDGIDNQKDSISLFELYTALREKLYKKQEPSMLTTEVVQHLKFAKNRHYNKAQEVKKQLILKSKAEIKKLISDNQITEAFEQLEALIAAKAEMMDGLVMIKNKYSRLQDEVMLGLISRDNSDIENNRIAYSLLTLLKKM